MPLEWRENPLNFVKFGSRATLTKILIGSTNKSPLTHISSQGSISPDPTLIGAENHRP